MKLMFIDTVLYQSMNHPSLLDVNDDGPFRGLSSFMRLREKANAKEWRERLVSATMQYASLKASLGRSKQTSGMISQIEALTEGQNVGTLAKRRSSPPGRKTL